MTNRLATALLFSFSSLFIACGPALALGNICSVSGSTATSLGNYNSFSGTGFAQVPVTLNLTRYIRSGNQKTQLVDFYVSQPAGSPAGYDVRYQNTSVLYVYPASHPLFYSPTSGTVYYNFGPANQPDTVSIPLLITIPAGLDLTAGAPLAFNIVYICKGSGGLDDVVVPTTLNNAITVQMNIQSALQASYAGPALDFGEVGAVTDVQALQHTVSGAVRVASTGPYAVSMSSQNNYKMLLPGGNPAIASQTLRYSTRLLGQTVDSNAPAFGPVTCLRAGTAGQNLSLSVTLREGGIGKIASSRYQDDLTVTITPLATAGSAQNCPNL